MSEGAFEVSRVVRFTGTRRAGAVYLTEGADKYDLGTAHAPIDCEARVGLCRAACCRLRVPLTRQDLDEGIVEWDPDEPYLTRQRPDGYCVHCDSASHRCTTYDHRPGLCRTYDCRGDSRIWVDFDRRIPSPLVRSLEDSLGSPDPAVTGVG